MTESETRSSNPRPNTTGEVRWARAVADGGNGSLSMPSACLRAGVVCCCTTGPPSWTSGSQVGAWNAVAWISRSEEHTSELQSQSNLGCRPLLEKKMYCHERGIASAQTAQYPSRGTRQTSNEQLMSITGHRSNRDTAGAVSHCVGLGVSECTCF